MASKKNTPEVANGNRSGAKRTPVDTKQPPNPATPQAHPTPIGAPFLSAHGDSPANWQVKAQPRGPAGQGLRAVCTPDRPNAVAVAVGGAVTAPDYPPRLDTTGQPSQSPAQPPAQRPAGTAGEQRESVGLGRPAHPLSFPKIGESGKADALTTLQKRARAKGFSQALARRLTDLGDSTPMRWAYLASVECSERLRQDAGVVRGKYCDARWCVVCNRIRTAKLSAAYGPELASWNAPYFVTLTLPNCSAKALHSVVRELIAAVGVIKRGMRRTDGLAFRAVRKLEVTYNGERKDFHPHLHFVVDSQAAADALLCRWLALHPEASRAAQDIRPATNPAELFKYVTKLVTKGLDGERKAPPSWALDTIFKALKGLRTIQPMGFRVTPEAETLTADDGVVTLDASTPAPIARAESVDWEWIGGAVQDWVDLTTGEVLSGHSPTPAHLRLLANVRSG